MSMRRYINLVESEQTLFEAQNYGDMLNDVRKLAKMKGEGGDKLLVGIETAAKMMINDVRPSLKKSDRIVSFIRQWKIGLILKLRDQFSPDSDGGHALQTLLERITRDMETRVPNINRDDLWSACERMYRNHKMVLQEIEHFLSLPVPAIRNQVFGYEPIYMLFQLFREAETEWKKQAAQTFPYDPNDGVVVEKFEDGWFWLLLDRPSCSAEGAAMGHCGNTASPQRGDKVLSFRKIVKFANEDYVRPSLTFILQQDGYLGEMKGRANNKPKAEYHPYIITLLKNDLIKGIRGGGYDPRNNFSMNDLDDATREALINEKPALGTLLDYYKRVGKVDDHVRTELEKGGQLFWLEGHDDVVAIDKWEDGINDFVHDRGNRSAKWIIKVFSGDDSPDYNGYTDEGAKELLGNLSKSSIRKIGDYVVSTYPDEIESWKEDEYEDEFDPTDDDHIAALLERTNDEIWDSLKRANETGYRYGAEAEMAESLRDALASYAPTIRLSQTSRVTFGLLYDTDDKGKLRSWDAPVYVTMKIEDAITLISDDGFGEEWNDFSEALGEADDSELDVSEPYSGWSDYDKEAALEDFFQEQSAYAPEKEKPKVENAPLDLTGWTVETLRDNEYTGQREIKIRNAEGVQVMHRSGARGTDEEILAELGKELANR